MNLIPNTDNPVELFLALVQISSPSRQEQNIVEAISTWLKENQIDFEIDQADQITGGNSGNLIAKKPAKANPNKPTILFVTHVDTVEKTGDRIIPVIDENNIIRSSSETILGADNKSAVAAVLSVLYEKDWQDKANLIAAFTTSEEVGIMGAANLDKIATQVDYAFSIDGSYPVGTFINSALGCTTFTIKVIGKSAHAAKDPGGGIHSLLAASQVVSKLKLGQNDGWLLNVSEIEGQENTNIIPANSLIKGEFRSFNQSGYQKAVDHLNQVINDVLKETDASINLSVNLAEENPPFQSPMDKKTKEIVSQAVKEAGVQLTEINSSVTLEANIIQAAGMATIAIASGGENPHSFDEFIEADELNRLKDLLNNLLIKI
jgi:tripeptide aminopeptidase